MLLSPFAWMSIIITGVQTVQTELVLFAQPTEDLLLPLQQIKAEEKGLNSGYYAHAQRTRDISRTRPRGWVKLLFTPCIIIGI